MHFIYKCVEPFNDSWKYLMNGICQLCRPLHYYRELPLFFNACDINLNATHFQTVEGVNQRVFDVPACGGFLITDHQKAIDSFSEPRKEIITDSEREEISEVVRFYQKNSRGRKK